MVNVSLIEAILREQDDPGCSTTRQIRDIYNIRSGEDPIIQHSDEDKEFQAILLKALEAFPIADDEEDKPISYTVKLKDSDDSSTPTMKRRSIIKLPKETKEQSDSDETSSDSDKPLTTSSITITKPFSPLFLNNMKKFGVSTDWLAKRSNSLRQSSYSRSSVKSNTSKLDAMIKSASAKTIRSNRKLSFVEPTTPPKVEPDKENTDPLVDTNEKKDESKEIAKSTSYDLSSEIDEDEKDIDLSPTSREFSLRIPRVSLPDEEHNRLNSSTSSSNDESKQEKPKLKKKRKSKKQTKKSPKKSLEKQNEQTKDSPKKSLEKQDKQTKKSPKKSLEKQSEQTKDSPKKSLEKQDKQTKKSPRKSLEKQNEQTKDSPKKSLEKQDEQTKKSPRKSLEKQDEQTKDSPKKSLEKQDEQTTDDTKKSSQKKDKNDQEQSRIEHLKKLLRISGIRLMIKKTELDELPSNKAKINYLKSFFHTAGFTGNLTIKDCEKFRKKRDTEKELLEIQANAVDVKGHVKGGRTLRGQGRNTDEIDFNSKRKRTASSEIENNDNSSDDDHKPIIKKRRIFKMEASPEVSENEELN